MDGIQLVQTRIAELDRLMGKTQAPSTSAPASPSTTPSSTSAGTFAELLGQATASTDTTINAKGVPNALATYGNGRAPASALMAIDSHGNRLWGPAAQAFKAMAADAARAGLSLPINDSYRTHDEQVQMAKTKGLYGQGGLAAKPGTSEHGWGLSVDIEINAKSEQWMRNNASRYGFVNNVPGEKWHWTYKGTA